MSPILRDFQRSMRGWFIGMSVPHVVSVSDDRVINGVGYVYGVCDHERKVVVEKLHKFNRKALRNANKRKTVKANPRYNGGEDTMIIPVGKPGSPERKSALAEQYAAILASGEEVSPFGWEN